MDRSWVFSTLVVALRLVPGIFAERASWILGNAFARLAGARVVRWMPTIFLNGNGTLELGPSLFVRRGVEFRIFDDQIVRLGNGVDIDSYTILEPNANGSIPGYIHVADDVFIGAFCQFNGDGGLTIGRGTGISAYTRIAANTHELELSEVVLRRPKTCRGITIGEYVYVGAHVSIMDGVTIGDYAVIGAGSVVLHSIPPRSIAVGSPARVIKTL